MIDELIPALADMIIGTWASTIAETIRAEAKYNKTDQAQAS